MSEKKMPSLDSLFGGCSTENPENSENNISFLMPGGIREAETAERNPLEQSGWNTASDGFVPSADATEEDDNAELPSERVEITDVLYGNNKGFFHRHLP